jgi:hypothetical protein
MIGKNEGTHIYIIIENCVGTYTVTKIRSLGGAHRPSIIERNEVVYIALVDRCGFFSAGNIILRLEAPKNQYYRQK